MHCRLAERVAQAMTQRMLGVDTMNTQALVSIGISQKLSIQGGRLFPESKNATKP